VGRHHNCDLLIAQRVQQIEQTFLRRRIQPGERLVHQHEFCFLCQGEGFYGRIAVREVIKISEQVRQAVRSNCSPAEILKLATGEGMTTMAEYAMQLVADGLTTEAEVKENIG